MVASLEITNLILIFISCIYWFLITPVQFCYVHEFWRLKKQKIAFFTKRHPSLVLFNVIIFNLYASILHPILDFIQLNQLLELSHPLILICSNVLESLAVLITIRLWLLYYDFNHELHTLSMKWTSEITGDDTNLPWTLKYKWMGNLKILSVFGAVFVVIIMVIAVYVIRPSFKILLFSDKKPLLPMLLFYKQRWFLNVS